MTVGIANAGQPFLPCPGDLRCQVKGVDTGVMDLQVPPEQPAQVAGDRPERGVVEVRCPLGEVLHHQVPDGPAFDAVLADDLLDAAASVDAQRPQPQRSGGGQDPGLLEQCVEQRAARASPEMVFLQGGRQLDTVADGDVGDEPALADHYPGELVQSVRTGPPDRILRVLLEPAESPGIDRHTGLGQHQRVTLPHQPPVGRPDHLPGHQQHQTAGQLVAPMPRGWFTTQRQSGPFKAGRVRPARQPPVLPGLTGLALQPVQQLGQPAPPRLVPAATRARVGEGGQQPLGQGMPLLARLPPASRQPARLPLLRLLRRRSLSGAHRRAIVDLPRHHASPVIFDEPNNVANTSGR